MTALNNQNNKFLKERRKAIKTYILIDYMTTLIAWVIFWIYRKQWLYDANPEWETGIIPWNTRDYVIGLFLIPGLWLFLHFISGAYFDPYRKSRIHEINRTIIISLIGALIIGFTAIANDWATFVYFFKITSFYFLGHTFITIIGRLIFLNRIKRKLIQKKYGYNTIIIGTNGKILKTYNELMSDKNADLYLVKGFLTVDNHPVSPETSNTLHYLGSKADLSDIIDSHEIEEVVIALDSKEHTQLEDILVTLSYKNVYIKILPDTYDILSGGVKTSNVFEPIFLTIRPQLLPDWQQVVKRLVDVMASAIGIFILLPVYILSAILVKKSSKGPILYKQERIGLFGKPFYILKFRSMYMDSEINGPALSKTHDPRITPWGRIMRKWRIDELPQFFNILKGDMSLVGPRPERQFFIDQIITTHPHYKYLHRVKPGLTSWGMVKYGYAENIQEMIIRMKYDLLYIKNCSILLDIKIILHTLKVVAQGRGK